MHEEKTLVLNVPSQSVLIDSLSLSTYTTSAPVLCSVTPLHLISTEASTRP